MREVWKGVLSGLFDGKMRILDVGTGTGFLAILLAELGHEVVGLDLSRGMIEVAREKARKAGVKVEFKLGDAENLPFRDRSFDAVICRHLLWTLPNPEKAVEEWSRVVKSGGKVVVIDGKWYDRSVRTKIRRFVGRIGIALCERRNPWKNYHYRKDVNKELPFYGGSSPEKVVGLFRNAGLSASVKDLSWIREMQKKELSLAYRIAWTGRAYYLIEGTK
jgi:ubiquinone/menaquinone biosynthesis C-methylase UbiE